MKIAFFASSLVSAYWNGAATYYRGIVKALHQVGHRITFYEPDAYERQQNRDMEDPDWATVKVYKTEEKEVMRMLQDAAGADLIVKASGVGVFDELLEREVLKLKNKNNAVVFWDVDAPATLDRVNGNPDDAFAKLIPQYDLVFTYGGGPPVINAYKKLGAKDCVPIYNGLDPDTHHPVMDNTKFIGDLAFLGNRLPDREARVEEFFLKPATKLAERRFIIGGSGWGDKNMPANVNYIGHVYTKEHNAFNCTPLAVLNISRESMARYGFSPATRVFEAAGAGACIITDEWEGIAEFFDPGEEILVARNGEEVAALLEGLDENRSARIGNAALKRVMGEHTYAHRVKKLEEALAKIGVGQEQEQAA